MTTKPEQPGANRLSIEERIAGASRDISDLELDILRGCVPTVAILRRWFEDLGGTLPWYVACKKCNTPTPIWTLSGVCPKCGELECPAAEVVNSIQPPLRVSIPAEGHTFSNVSINGAKVTGAQTSEGVGTPPKQEQNTAESSISRPSLSNEHPQSEPLCRVKGCGKPLQYHTRLGEYNSHPFDSTTERRIGAKERRVAKTGFCCWCLRRDPQQIGVGRPPGHGTSRTGPSDRRRKPLQDSIDPSTNAAGKSTVELGSPNKAGDEDSPHQSPTRTPDERKLGKSAGVDGVIQSSAAQPGKKEGQ